jgi:hypothetical protein
MQALQHLLQSNFLSTFVFVIISMPLAFLVHLDRSFMVKNSWCLMPLSTILQLSNIKAVGE